MKFLGIAEAPLARICFLRVVELFGLPSTQFRLNWVSQIRAIVAEFGTDDILDSLLEST